ncbi:aconitase family protein [Xinfangfangia sp. CPCC 101601]|uniref:Aconitase family protein n=1 Tax=Pseudogemmobacter lacusdianii TaxID=3069608 RepID=A0ABU0W1N1_9RHOB|nr:aconitase family protein [Xinfangfangia sp. CPCC 101601]MDQ2066975.1 aconitase family protein [Xinfangfangia sp. CPCC 101601]
MIQARFILEGVATGDVLATDEPISFWGGVDPASGKVIDVHHPLHGQSLAGRVLVMPGTRGSCTGSGVLLDMALNGKAPAAVIFSQPEDVVTLGALIAGEMFNCGLPVLRVSEAERQLLAASARVVVTPEAIEASGVTLPLSNGTRAALELSDEDRAMLAGRDGEAVALAMRMIVKMAEEQGAERLIDVTCVHIDGCIYASPANLTFAEKMVEMGAKVRVPATMNAISVDRENWQAQGLPPSFGGPAARLADAYVKMGCSNTFTCSPYLLDDAPQTGEMIGWSESNAVIYANSVIGARTAKHPDFLDLCIAMTGRAPLSGVYLEENRLARRIINVSLIPNADDLFWPLLGWLAGKASPDRIPVFRGLNSATQRQLQALCAAFGTTSAAPMLHVEGVTPEAHLIDADADEVTLTAADFAHGWTELNQGSEEISLVAIGSPHASAEECRAFADALEGGAVTVPTIITAGRKIIADLRAEGTLARLEASGVQVLPDLCWCSISEPVFPVATRTLMTNSGKYAHYGPGLSGRLIRFDSLARCATAALTGHAPKTLPNWM